MRAIANVTVGSVIVLIHVALADRDRMALKRETRSPR
jgi:hypothetical protein